MENENDLYTIVDAQGNYDYASYIRRRAADNPYLTYNIDVEAELTRIICENGETWSGKIEKSPEPDSILKETLTNLKLGLKPYYQEKIEYYIEGSNAGAYIEYDPYEVEDLEAPRKIEWFPPSLVTEINLCYELKKKLHDDHIEAKRRYKMAISDIDTSILNYKTKGHDLNL